MSELIPCPFCGGTDSTDNACQMAKIATRSFKSAIGKTAYQVECGCGAKGPADLVWGKANAAWNTRTPAVPLQEGEKR